LLQCFLRADAEIKAPILRKTCLEYSSKWAKLAKCSQNTAGRDIDDLVKRGILIKNAAGGRSTSYSLAKIP
jgi:Fic family protein